MKTKEETVKGRYIQKLKVRDLHHMVHHTNFDEWFHRPTLDHLWSMLNIASGVSIKSQF